MEKEKIKAEELRIGNYFYDSDNVLCELVYFKPNKKGYCDLYCKLPNDKSIPLARTTTHYAKPIRLTEEWLIRFGFEKTLVNWQRTEISLPIHVTKFDGEIVLIPNRQYALELKYVHQLQNLYFSLLGTELTLTPKE